MNVTGIIDYLKTLDDDNLQRYLNTVLRLQRIANTNSSERFTAMLELRGSLALEETLFRIDPNLL